MSQLKTWRTAGEQEDWLRTRGKLLGFVAQTLANSLRMDCPPVPARLEHFVHDHITPVSAEYIRRETWRDSTLTEYQKLQLHGYTIRTYAYVSTRHKGDLSDPGRCMEEIVRTPLAPHDLDFDSRMWRVIPLFDAHFNSADARQFHDFDQSFTAAFMVQVGQILKESGVHLRVSAEDATRLYKVFQVTGVTVRQMLAD